MSRVEFGDRRACRRLVQSMRGERSVTPSGFTAAAVFLLISILVMHAPPSGGYLPYPVVVSNEGSPREPQPAQHSREVDDMRARTMIGVLAVAALGSPSMAAELLVPEQYPTIQAAFAACTPDDVVSLAPGTYDVGLITMPGIPVTLKGRGLRSATVIQGEAIQIFSGSGPRTIEGLTLRGMTGYGAIHVNGAAAIVRNVTVEMSSNGVFLDTNASVETVNCTFRQNVHSGGYAYVNCFWTALDCDFDSGNAVGFYGGAVGFHVGSGCSFLRCRFTSNYATLGGAIGLSFPGSRVFDECYFEGNSSPNGNVWWTEYGATGTLKNSVLCGHSPADFSGSWIDGGGNQFFPKGCTPPCPADLVDDNAVNGADLAIILVAWGT
ncbi:MAG: hypothetical protein RLY21_2642, partial [Planctomycetota bacterium]